MRNIKYFLAKMHYKLAGDNKEVMSNYFRKSGMHIGTGCNICCNIMTTEPYLISIGNDTTISGDVQLITHDNSVCKICGNGNDLFGEIVIGNNCFIGARTTILYGVSIPDNCIVGACSTVTKSLESGYVYAGNPAEMICTIEDWRKKNSGKIINTKDLNSSKRREKVINEKKKWIER